MSNRKFFTLIETLVVTTIILIITTVSIVSYSQFLKTSRDSKRKADFELIRNSLELYRSNNDSYPDLITKLSPVYLPHLPKDPKTGLDYSFTKDPADCDGTAVQPCTSYILSVVLEKGVVYNATPFGYTNLEPTSTPISPTPTSIQLPTSTPTIPSPTPTTVPTNVPTATLTPTPIPTATSSPTPTPTSAPTCPQTCAGSCPVVCRIAGYTCSGTKYCCYNVCL